MKSLRMLAAATVALLAGPMLTSIPAQAAPSDTDATWSPTLVSTEPLYDGSVHRLRYTDGITVVAPKGAHVIFEGSGALKTVREGRRVYDRAVRIVDPNAVNAASLTKAAADYAAQGRSIYDDALAAGYSVAQAQRMSQPQGAAADEPPIGSTGCVRSEDVDPDPEFEWSGCYKLYAVTDADESAWYAAGSGTAHGWGTGVLTGKTLIKGASQISWSGAGAEIIEASPAGSVASTNCRTAGINLAYIIEVTYTTQLCADGWNVTWNRALHKVEWHGESAGGDDDTRFASGASTVRLPFSTPTAYLNYRISWQYECFC